VARERSRKRSRNVPGVPVVPKRKLPSCCWPNLRLPTCAQPFEPLVWMEHVRRCWIPGERQHWMTKQQEAAEPRRWGESWCESVFVVLLCCWETVPANRTLGLQGDLRSLLSKLQAICRAALSLINFFEAPPVCRIPVKAKNRWRWS
jgi:hypothetical protein